MNNAKVRNSIDSKEFVRVWQTSESIDEVAGEFPEVPRKALGAKAAYLRKRGVPLKKFKPMRSSSTLDELIALAEETAE